MLINYLRCVISLLHVVEFLNRLVYFLTRVVCRKYHNPDYFDNGHVITGSFLDGINSHLENIASISL